MHFASLGLSSFVVGDSRAMGWDVGNLGFVAIIRGRLRFGKLDSTP